MDSEVKVKWNKYIEIPVTILIALDLCLMPCDSEESLKQCLNQMVLREKPMRLETFALILKFQCTVIMSSLAFPHLWLGYLYIILASHLKVHCLIRIKITQCSADFLMFPSLFCHYVIYLMVQKLFSPHNLLDLFLALLCSLN